MNVRILLISLYLLSSSCLLGMNLTKNNIYEHLSEEVVESTTKTKNNTVKAIDNKQSKPSKIPNNLSRKYVEATEKKFENTIKIDDSSNRMTLYIDKKNPQRNPIRYQTNVSQWFIDYRVSLQNAKYQDCNRECYIDSDEKKQETIRIHRFSKSIDAYIQHGISTTEKDFNNEPVTRIVLPGKVKYNESETAVACEFEYLFDSTGVCFHRNMILDIGKNNITHAYIATESYAKLFPPLGQ